MKRAIQEIKANLWVGVVLAGLAVTLTGAVLWAGSPTVTGPPTPVPAPVAPDGRAEACRALQGFAGTNGYPNDPADVERDRHRACQAET